jgi:hypothetical protein
MQTSDGLQHFPLQQLRPGAQQMMLVVLPPSLVDRHATSPFFGQGIQTLFGEQNCPLGQHPLGQSSARLQQTLIFPVPKQTELLSQHCLPATVSQHFSRPQHVLPHGSPIQHLPFKHLPLRQHSPLAQTSTPLGQQTPCGEQTS